VFFHAHLLQCTSFAIVGRRYRRWLSDGSPLLLGLARTYFYLALTLLGRFQEHKLQGISPEFEPPIRLVTLGVSEDSPWALGAPIEHPVGGRIYVGIDFAAEQLCVSFSTQGLGPTSESRRKESATSLVPSEVGARLSGEQRRRTAPGVGTLGAAAEGQPRRPQHVTQSHTWRCP